MIEKTVSLDQLADTVRRDLQKLDRESSAITRGRGALCRAPLSGGHPAPNDAESNSERHAARRVYGVVLESSTKPSRSRIGRLVGRASTWT